MHLFSLNYVYACVCLCALFCNCFCHRLRSESFLFYSMLLLSSDVVAAWRIGGTLLWGLYFLQSENYSETMNGKKHTQHNVQVKLV